MRKIVADTASSAFQQELAKSRNCSVNHCVRVCLRISPFQESMTYSGEILGSLFDGKIP
jgi:hypothetical protein